MAVKYKDYSLQEFFQKVDENKIVLPDFQRGYVWKEEQQRNLIASVLVDLPIGSTLHLEGSRDDFVARAICEQREVIPRDECEYLLDGQQRISTLYNVFKNVYSKEDSSWEEVWKSLFKELRYRWFIKIEFNDKDFFGYEKLLFSEKKLNSAEPKEIKGFIVSKQILKTKGINEWYHPRFERRNLKDKNKVRLELARLAAQNGLVPLYEIYKKEDGIHRLVLNELAIKRVEELKADIKDGKYTVEEILGPISPDIEDIKNDLSEVEVRWHTLRIKWVEKVSNFLEKLLEKKIPVILLPREEVGRAASIFEEINKGGVPLSNFDLVAAKVAKVVREKKGKRFVQIILDILKEKFSVEHLGEGVKVWKASLFTPIQDNLPSKRFQTIFLNLLSIIANEVNKKEISKSLISKGAILNLNPEDIVDHIEQVTRAIARAFAFLQLKCGHIDESVISYDYMVLPIAYLFYYDDIWKDISKINKIEAWFWSSLFSGAYMSRQDDQFIKDLKALKAWLIEENLKALEEVGWVEGDKVVLKSYVDKLFKKEDYSDKDTLLHINKAALPSKAMKNAILQYILSKKPRDFMPQNPEILTAYKGALGKPKLVVHHIIPLGSVTKVGQSAAELRKDKQNILNSPLNLTYISHNANEKIRDKRIDEYFNELTSFQIGTHLFPSDIRENLRSEDKIRDILSRRFELIETNLISHINKLLSV
jgi:uncharacterized protein with ParB-like and HNH nuclease domain